MTIFARLLILTFAFAATAATAAQRHYLLDGSSSRVAFSTDFGADRISGTFPVAAADLMLDFNDVTRCTITVALDAAGASASFPFAAQAMKGPKILDTRQFPTIDFSSTRVRRNGTGALVDGNLTIRGVTRPVTLAAVLAHTADNPGDMDHLEIRLTGAVSRSAFGASGWSDAVGDEVRLDIAARIARDR